jgi:hypothetical protein
MECGLIHGAVCFRNEVSSNYFQGFEEEEGKIRKDELVTILRDVEW